MKFFDRFKGNNLKLKGPNLDSAKVLDIDLSGTKLSFPAPRQTAMMPGHIQRFEFDLKNPSEFNQWNDSQNKGFIIHKNGWELTGENKRSFGYVKLVISLAKIKLEDSNSSLFDSAFADNWLLNDIDSIWGKMNNETIATLKGQSTDGYLFKFPTNVEQLSRLNSLNATYFSIIQPRPGIDTRYRIPIGKDLLLYIEFDLRTLDCDFFSPEHNFPEASEKLVKEFMNKVKVELSPEAESEKKSVSNN